MPTRLSTWKATPLHTRPVTGANRRRSVKVQWIAGVREGGTSAMGCPGTWEILLAPVEKRVGRSERKEAMTKGEQEVGVLRSSDEAGEPTQGTQQSEGGTELQNHSRER